MTLDGRKPEINYPTSWEYKIIGPNVDDLLKAVEEIIIGLEYQITPSNISRHGKYFRLNISVVVPSEILRDIIFQKLTSHPHIKFVI